jgi:putative Mg2+ transporter-C (MgtC) family protein
VFIDAFLNELNAGWLTAEEFARVVVRLTAAMLVGAVAGINRERVGKAAGLRTHMLVALGCAAFIVGVELAGMPQSDVSRVIQGLAAGIGFLGGGAILKSAEDKEIRGLTTAAGIWMTAGAGIAVGMGELAVGFIAISFAWVVLSVLARLEIRSSNDA